MNVTISDEQRQQLHDILGTHRHNMWEAALKAHGKDEKEYEFYWQKKEDTEKLIPLFAPPEEPKDEDEEEEEDEE